MCQPSNLGCFVSNIAIDTNLSYVNQMARQYQSNLISSSISYPQQRNFPSV